MSWPCSFPFISGFVPGCFGEEGGSHSSWEARGTRPHLPVAEPKLRLAWSGLDTGPDPGPASWTVASPAHSTCCREDGVPTPTALYQGDSVQAPCRAFPLDWRAVPSLGGAGQGPAPPSPAPVAPPPPRAPCAHVWRWPEQTSNILPSAGLRTTLKTVTIIEKKSIIS